MVILVGVASQVSSMSDQAWRSGIRLSVDWDSPSSESVRTCGGVGYSVEEVTDDLRCLNRDLRFVFFDDAERVYGDKPLAWCS